MSTSIYIACAERKIDESLLIAGASAADRYWLPKIQSLQLDFLEVAFGGGLTITKEHYPKVIEQIEALLAEFEKAINLMPEIEDALSHCSNLLAWLRQYPPASGYEVYIG